MIMHFAFHSFISSVAISLVDVRYPFKTNCVPVSWETVAITSNLGMGKGILKSKRISNEHIDLYAKYLSKPSRFQKFLQLTSIEFHWILDQLQNDLHKLEASPYRMTFSNKVLMGLLFVIEYPGNKVLASWFEVSEYYISKVLDEILPLLVGFFSRQIPHGQVSSKRSIFSDKIAFIIDCTLHRTRRPSLNQSEHYNGHYSMHGRLTQVLIDYEGNVIAFLTNVPGRCNDALVAMYNEDFKRIVGDNLVLGDPGFQGVQWVVSGFRLSQVNSVGKERFFTLSKQEQQLIEHVNAFVKTCKSIDKENTFIHSEARLLACVFISFGLYNLKRKWGHYVRME